MATIRKRGDYQWESRIRRKGFPTQSKTFETKDEALAWTAVIESEMIRGIFQCRAEAESTTLSELMLRYQEDITPGKAGAKQEVLRFKVLHRDPLSKRILATIQGKDIHTYIKRRLKTVSESTVNRELNLLGHVFTVAIKDWSIPLTANPVHMVRRPKVPLTAARTRRLEEGEEERLLVACNQENHWLHSVVVMATETGQRRGRLLEMRWDAINWEDRVITMPKATSTFKNAPVELPLSRRAIEELKHLPRALNGSVFPAPSPNSISMAFKRACNRANIENLHFHDLRHEATSRMIEKGMSEEFVRAITGHANSKMLTRYTHLRAKDLAKMLG